MTVMMPTTAEHGALATERRPLWHEVDRDFWVGNREGTFLGTVERRATGEYVAHDCVRQFVGVFGSRRQACAAIAARCRSEE